jgi:hypothetical protein
VEEADGIDPPGHVAVQDDGRQHEERGQVVDEEGPLAEGVCPVDCQLDGDVVEVVEPGVEQHAAGELVRPEGDGDVGMAEAVDAGEEEGEDEEGVGGDPQVVAEVVVPGLRHYFLQVFNCLIFIVVSADTEETSEVS